MPSSTVPFNLLSLIPLLWSPLLYLSCHRSTNFNRPRVSVAAAIEQLSERFKAKLLSATNVFRVEAATEYKANAGHSWDEIAYKGVMQRFSIPQT
jgi:hypothetical protein